MQQGMMFFFIGITMAIVQGIIRLFQRVIKTLQMRIIFLYICGTCSKNLPLPNPCK